MKIHFCSLGCGPFQEAAWRIANEARRTGVFETVTTYDYLPPQWYNGSNDQPQRDIKTRGAGYWFWKPKLIREILEEKAEEGDIVVYCDAGCKLYRSAEWQTFLDHFKQNPDLNCLAFFLPEHVDQTWSKGDLFAHFKIDLASREATSPQILATISFWRKSKETFKFIEDWQKLLDSRNLIDDSPSKTPNHPNFREHRHDQAAFSLLLKSQSTFNKLLLADPSYPQRAGQAIYAFRSKAGPWD